jgi:hypothetical protein
MILVALIAVLTATAIEGSRIRHRMRLWSQLYKYTSASHSGKKLDCLLMSDGLNGQALGFDRSKHPSSSKAAADNRIRAAELRRWADHEAALALKYQTASFHPWWSLPPDPPEPPTRRPETSGSKDVEAMILRFNRRLSER